MSRMQYQITRHRKKQKNVIHSQAIFCYSIACNNQAQSLVAYSS